MTKLDADWIFTPATRAVCSALARDGAQVLFVGGCVRNTLLGVDVSDIDIATDATPEKVLDLAAAAGIKAIPTGADHGTVTLVQEGVPYEITTFRRDVSTDGRRAIVAFSTEVAEDAARRDFTMNALYARLDGTVIDPLNGLPDLLVRRVRFIGQAEDRIREDYLRSLRFFRFHAWYGNQDHGFDADALAAIAANLDGLTRLSRERVGAEMLKLLAAPDPAPAVAAMRASGVLLTFLPGSDDKALAPLVHLETEAGVLADPVRRLAALGGSDVSDMLRLSRAQTTKLDALRDGAIASMPPAELGYRHGADMAVDMLLLRCAFTEHPWNAALREQAMQGENARFPLRAQDLMPRFQGPALGAELARLEALWIASGFSLDGEALLRRSDLP